MNQSNGVAIGLDMGTGGARAVAVDLQGKIVSQGATRLPTSATTINGDRIEQDPHSWHRAAQAALRNLMDHLSKSTMIVGVAIDATSGTFLFLDEKNLPITAGIMYNDLRAAEMVPMAAEKLDPVLNKYGIRIAPSFALPKIIHQLRELHPNAERCHRIVHQTDWLVGMLTGRFDVTDISTALKTGAEPGTLSWPEELDQLDVPREKLPQIVLPGEPIGRVNHAAAEVTCLPVGTPVVAGCTDGTAGCLASGARSPGDLNVTLGSTMVFKAVATRPILDPAGAVYNHRHPAGGYLPGAASSTGAEWLDHYLAGEDLDALSAAAVNLLPTGLGVYPLVKRGERFPFLCGEAQGYGMEDIDDPVLRLAAGMEGVALLERMAIERLEEIGLRVRPTIFATGGGAANDLWLRIRATVNHRCYSVPANSQCAIGAAILAATPTVGSCEDATAAMVHAGRMIEPMVTLTDAYNDAYGKFVESLQGHGFIVDR